MCFFARIFITGKHKTIYIEKEAPSHAGIYVSNHAKLGGPLALELYFPYPKRPWVIAEVCDMRQLPKYAMKDFWPNNKPKRIYKLFSYVVAPFGHFLMWGAQAILVYNNEKLLITIRKRIQSLEDNYCIFIFPEFDAPYSEYHNDFKEGFVDIAKYYDRKTKKKLKFYLMYECYEKRIMSIGYPIEYNPENSMEFERTRIVSYLKENVTS
jgi:hypothetical protein